MGELWDLLRSRWTGYMFGNPVQRQNVGYRLSKTCAFGFSDIASQFSDIAPRYQDIAELRCDITKSGCDITEIQ